MGQKKKMDRNIDCYNQENPVCLYVCREADKELCIL